MFKATFLFAMFLNPKFLYFAQLLYLLHIFIVFFLKLFLNLSGFSGAPMGQLGLFFSGNTKNMFEDDAIYFQSERNKDNLGSNLLIGMIWTDVLQKYFCRLFCQFPPPPQLHENERNWTERRRCVSGAPLDPSMNTEVTYYHVHPEKLRLRLRIPPQIEKRIQLIC